MIDEMSLISKIKDAFKEVLASVSMSKQEDQIEPIEPEALAEQTPSEPTEPQPSAEEPTPEPQETVVEPQPTVEPQAPKEEPTEPKNEPQEEAPKDNHLEDLIKSLKEEIDALKKMNSGLDKKVKELSKQPSTAPVNVNAKPNSGGVGVDSSTYQAWRNMMREMY